MRLGRVRYGDGSLHDLGVARPGILRVRIVDRVVHLDLIVRTLSRRVSVARDRAVTLAPRRLPSTVAFRVIVHRVVGNRRIVSTLRATLRPIVITVRLVGSRDLRIRPTVVMILATTDELRVVMGLFRGGIVGVRRVGRFVVVGKATLLAPRPLLG